MAEADIGCSLAEAAESQSYTSYLEQAASGSGPALHVVYINTSLRTKAHAHAIVPTITCTSGNVVQTILQVPPHHKSLASTAKQALCSYIYVLIQTLALPLLCRHPQPFMAMCRGM